MDMTYIRKKLPVASLEGADFLSKSSVTDPRFDMFVSVSGGLHYVLTTTDGSYQSTYYADSEKELVVEARSEILVLSSSDNKITKLSRSGEPSAKLSIGAQVVREYNYPDGAYKIVRENRMVSSYSELVRLPNGDYFMTRRVGMLEHTTLKVRSIEDGLYVFLMNLETIKSNPDQLKEIANWTKTRISILEGRRIEPTHKIKLTKHNAWLGLTVSFKTKANPELRQGMLLSIDIGTTVDVVEDGEVIRVPKNQVWI